MKSYIFIVLFALTAVFLNFNQSDAQIQLPNSTNDTIQADLSDEFYKQGNVLFDEEKYGEAISYYDKALGINSNSINILYNKALALDKLERHDEAIAYYDKVLAITPNDTDSLNNKGLDLNVLGKYDEAISNYDKALAVLPNDTDTLYNKGVALDNLGKHDMAMVYYDKVLDIDPANVDALNKMNLTFNNANKTEINAIGKSDESLLIGIGAVIAILAGIIIADLVKKIRKKSEQEELLPKILLKPEDPPLTKAVNPQQLSDYEKISAWVDEMREKKPQQQKSNLII